MPEIPSSPIVDHHPWIQNIITISSLCLGRKHLTYKGIILILLVSVYLLLASLLAFKIMLKPQIAVLASVEIANYEHSSSEQETGSIPVNMTRIKGYHRQLLKCSGLTTNSDSDYGIARARWADVYSGLKVRYHVTALNKYRFMYA